MGAQIADKQFQDSLEFRRFRRQLFHSSLARILSSLKPWMTKPRVTLCSDGHFRRVIYGLGPYIADYPEQTLLSLVVSGWCPKWVWSIGDVCYFVKLDRCTALPTNLDDDLTAIPRCHEHTEALQAAFVNEPKILWDGYGIISDIIVCHIIQIVITTSNLTIMPAIYCSFPSCRHP